MKNPMLKMLLGAALLLGAFGAARAAEDRPGPEHGPRDPELRKRLMEKFDKDGDGKLDEAERAAARKAWQERREEGGPRGPLHEEILKRFDADGDGKLNEAERAKAREAFQERRKERGEGPDRGPRPQGERGGKGERRGKE